VDGAAADANAKNLVNDIRAHSVHVLNTTDMTWYVPQKISKKPLKQLYNHAVCAAGMSSLVVFGGFDGQQSLNEFKVTYFDLGEQL
jgi:hypothetical protein